MLRGHELRMFLSFVVFGVALGLVENLLALTATGHAIDVRAAVISLLVVIPFAAVGEIVVDRKPLLPKGRFEIFFEFLVFGVTMGVVEDMIVLGVLAQQTITLQTVGIVLLVTLPFAALGELVVDRGHWFCWLQEHSTLARS